MNRMTENPAENSKFHAYNSILHIFCQTKSLATTKTLIPRFPSLIRLMLPAIQHAVLQVGGILEKDSDDVILNQEYFQRILQALLEKGNIDTQAMIQIKFLCSKIESLEPETIKIFLKRVFDNKITDDHAIKVMKIFVHFYGATAAYIQDEEKRSFIKDCKEKFDSSGCKDDEFFEILAAPELIVAKEVNIDFATPHFPPSKPHACENRDQQQDDDAVENKRASTNKSIYSEFLAREKWSVIDLNKFNDNLTTIYRLLLTNPGFINLQNNEGETLFHIVLSLVHGPMVYIFLNNLLSFCQQNGIEVDLNKVDISGKNLSAVIALNHRIFWRQAVVINLLLVQHGLDPRLRDHQGHHLLCRIGERLSRQELQYYSPELFYELLTSHQFDLNLGNNQGRSVVYYFLKYLHKKSSGKGLQEIDHTIINELIKQGAQINIKYQGKSLKHYQLTKPLSSLDAASNHSDLSSADQEVDENESKTQATSQTKAQTQDFVELFRDNPTRLTNLVKQNTNREWVCENLLKILPQIQTSVIDGATRQLLPNFAALIHSNRFSLTVILAYSTNQVTEEQLKAYSSSTFKDKLFKALESLCKAFPDYAIELLTKTLHDNSLLGAIFRKHRYKKFKNMLPSGLYLFKRKQQNTAPEGNESTARSEETSSIKAVKMLLETYTSEKDQNQDTNGAGFDKVSYPTLAPSAPPQSATDVDETGHLNANNEEAEGETEGEKPEQLSTFGGVRL